MSSTAAKEPASETTVARGDWQDQIGLSHPLLRRLADYWDDLRGADRMAQRGAIEPWCIADLLPHVFMWSYESENGELRFRLAGEEILKTVGYWPRGTRIEEMFAEKVATTVKRRYLRTIKTPAIGHVTGQAILANGARIPCERLILPLGDDGHSATDLLGISFYDFTSCSRVGRYQGERVRERFWTLD